MLKWQRSSLETSTLRWINRVGFEKVRRRVNKELSTVLEIPGLSMTSTVYILDSKTIATLIFGTFNSFLTAGLGKKWVYAAYYSAKTAHKPD